MYKFDFRTPRIIPVQVSIPALLVGEKNGRFLAPSWLQRPSIEQSVHVCWSKKVINIGHKSLGSVVDSHGEGEEKSTKYCSTYTAKTWLVDYKSAESRLTKIDDSGRVNIR